MTLFSANSGLTRSLPYRWLTNLFSRRFHQHCFLVCFRCWVVTGTRKLIKRRPWIWYSYWRSMRSCYLPLLITRICLMCWYLLRMDFLGTKFRAELRVKRRRLRGGDRSRKSWLSRGILARKRRKKLSSRWLNLIKMSVLGPLKQPALSSRLLSRRSQ